MLKSSIPIPTRQSDGDSVLITLAEKLVKEIMEMTQVTFASMTSEIYIQGEHPELTEAIGNYLQWLALSRFKQLNRALWMREGTLNENELDELRKLSSNLLFASRASGMMVKSYHFQTYMMDGEFGELSWRQESYDIVGARE